LAVVPCINGTIVAVGASKVFITFETTLAKSALNLGVIKSTFGAGRETGVKLAVKSASCGTIKIGNIFNNAALRFVLNNALRPSHWRNCYRAKIAIIPSQNIAADLVGAWIVFKAWIWASAI
jgi:hypothetical protein